jgi:hypothetical protein
MLHSSWGERSPGRVVGLLVPGVRHSGENLVINTNQMAANDMVELS